MEYLTSTVSFGLGRFDAAAAPDPVPAEQLSRASAASRRLDDTFRTYLAERVVKILPFA